MTVLIYCLFLLQGILLHSATAGDIPTVHLKRLITLDGPSFTIEWDPVENSDVNDPIIGLKIKLWKLPCVLKSVYTCKDGQSTKVVKLEHEVYHHQSVPDELPVHVSIVKPEELSVTVPRIDGEVWYIVRALAFTKTTEGSYSNAYQFLVAGDEKDKKNSCEKIISETPVSPESEDEFQLICL